jgi:hypothetical protein
MPTLSEAHHLKIKVADSCWIALALLHREQQERKSFTPKEIVGRACRIGGADHRPAIQAHTYGHNVANLPRVSGGYRMFFRMPDDTLRLYCPSDPAHSSRTGKIRPDAKDIPSEYRDLLRWYDEEYCEKAVRNAQQDDPVLSMRGLGKHLWKDESGDEFIQRERTGW